MKKIKIVFAVFLSFVILGSAVVFGASITKSIQVTYRNISILVNGKIVPSEQEPFIYQGRTFVPLRTIGEAVNKTVEWDNAKNQISIKEPVSSVTRLGSYSDLSNYMPDNFQFSKTTDKLSVDEIIKLEEILKKYRPSSKLDFEKPIKSYRLTSDNEELIVFSLNVGTCIRYQDQSLYFITPKYTYGVTCASIDGWKAGLSHNLNNESDQDYFYFDYLIKINYSILKDKPNRTKQITDLFAISLWVDALE